uniref:GIR1-like zinc ribbon domain-containing protein n=1 Tax=Kalanchoe fedtschenkoi TaxID=63787 RepID=A0A7N0V6T4_KALFE
MMGTTGADQRLDDRSPANSCVSSDDEDNQINNNSNRTGKPPAMVLVGCQRCLMYIMLAHDESKCPKCEGSVLLEFSRYGGFRLTKT